MYCNNCGATVPDESSFCYLCGKSINATYNSTSETKKELNIVNNLHPSLQDNFSDSSSAPANIENETTSTLNYDEDKKYKKIRKVILITILIMAVSLVLRDIFLYQLDQQNIDESFNLTPVIHDISYLVDIGLSNKEDKKHVENKMVNKDGVHIIIRNGEIISLTIDNPKYSFMDIYVGQYSGLINNSRIAYYIDYIFRKDGISYKRYNSRDTDVIRYKLENNYIIEISTKNNRIDCITYVIEGLISHNIYNLDS